MTNVGRGKIEYENGNVYVGKFLGCGKAQDDNATFTYANGNVYTGAWADGSPNGTGTLKYSSGYVYSGEWKDGKRHGMGEEKYSSGNVYKGEFRSGKRHGKGKLTWISGDEFDGEWANNMRDGRGAYKWKDGCEHNGEYKDGKRHGQGTYTFANGDTLIGEWVKSKKQGTFAKYEASTGHEYKVEYKEGKRMSSKRIALLINGRGAKRSRTDDAVGAVVMDEKDTTCTICQEKFGFETDGADETAKRRLPVLSSSRVCDHYFCHECVLKEQMRIARDENNGRVPKWIRCMVCREKTAFCPREPKYHRMLIDNLSRLVPVEEATL